MKSTEDTPSQKNPDIKAVEGEREKILDLIYNSETSSEKINEIIDKALVKITENTRSQWSSVISEILVHHYDKLNDVSKIKLRENPLTKSMIDIMDEKPEPETKKLTRKERKRQKKQRKQKWKKVA